jgi:fructose-1,6-bisphosphatase/inositol monophosphatase family enzyme
VLYLLGAVLLYGAYGTLDIALLAAHIRPDPATLAAAALIVREAGGVVTDFSGRAHQPELPEVAASNGWVHGKLVGMLRVPSRSTPHP